MPHCLFLPPLRVIDPLRHDRSTALAGGNTEECYILNCCWVPKAKKHKPKLKV